MVTLLILDGFGISDKTEGNAIKLQGTPNLNKLSAYPYTTIEASGLAVGLTEGQMGNSEVGHLNLGAGRVVYQDLPKINNEIKTKKIEQNKALLSTFDHVKSNNSDLHFMGLLSDGGVHSHIDHLKALIDFANSYGVKNIYIHAITDGRDTLRDSGLGFVQELEQYAMGKAQVASVVGRVYAMDRENRFDRIEKAYDMLVHGKAERFESAESVLTKSYEQNVFDEFVEPAITRNFKNVKNGDGFVFFNYRTDRAREITMALTQPNKLFDSQIELNNFKYCCLTEYSTDFVGVEVAYPQELVTENLSKIISENNLKQLHITESTKYAHVTFFFNGGIETPYKNEDRILIESANVKDFSEMPKMRCFEITEKVLEKMHEYDFVLINLSNPDMIGHTGNLDAAIKAIEAVDECAYKIAQKTLELGGDCIITADHGNAEEMIDNNGNVLTQHSTNPVPVWLVSNNHKNVKLKGGALCNIAPTVLKLLKLKKPSFMEDSLF